MIQEAIRELLETKLNDNTKDKTFKVGQYAYIEDEDKHFIYNIKTGYQLIEKNYIPCMITFNADYDALPDQINGKATIGIDFLVEAEDKSILDSDLLAVNEIVSKIVGNYEDITDGSITYESVWNMEAILPAGVTRPLNGVYYTKLQTTVYIEFSDTNTFGNAYRYYLNDNLLTLYDGSVDRENEENYPQRLNDKEARGGIDTSQWSSTMVSYVDTFLETIIDEMSSADYVMDTVYTYTEKKKGVVLHTFPVMITSISKPIVLGEKQYVTISLIKSDKS